MKKDTEYAVSNIFSLMFKMLYVKLTLQKKARRCMTCGLFLSNDSACGQRKQAYTLELTTEPVRARERQRVAKSDRRQADVRK
ncbi:MAG: hypothetical protein Q4B57_06070 [Eubacteriales bacterium]|nr:hypothetical protein [Eubacteriales bacterium]